MGGNLTANEPTHRRIALVFDPVVRSGMVLYVFVLFILVELISVRFHVYKLAEYSLIVDLFGITGRSNILIAYFFQCLLLTLSVIIFVNNFVSRGARLSKSMLKKTNLSGKVALVTGGYSGIGYEIVLQLLKWNCKVVICGRNKTKATNAIEKLKSTNSFDPNNVSFIEMDLDNLLSVKKAAELFLKNFDRLDFLINNAGIWLPKLTVTNFNLESQFSTNFLGHFYLTQLLLDIVKKTHGRILNVSSIAHFKYNPTTDPIFENKSTTSLNTTFNNSYYGRSKLYNVWLTNALQRRLNMDGRKAVCVSLAPGVVNTPLLWPLAKYQFYLIPKYINLLVVKRPVDGAANALFLCAVDSKYLLPGGYYDNMKLAFVSHYAHDHEREEKLYEFAQELVDKLTK